MCDAPDCEESSAGKALALPIVQLGRCSGRVDVRDSSCWTRATGSQQRAKSEMSRSTRVARPHRTAAAAAFRVAQSELESCIDDEAATFRVHDATLMLLSAMITYLQQNDRRWRCQREGTLRGQLRAQLRVRL